LNPPQQEGSEMKTGMLVISSISVLLLASLAAGQGTNPEVQQKLAAMKESVARNQAELRQYTWTERTQVSLKGEVKKTEQSLCRYGPDGKVQKTPLGPPSPEQTMRGIRGRVAEKVKDDLTDFMQQAKSLIQAYVPPSPQLMESGFGQGNVSLGQAGPGMVQLLFHNYLKPGDALTFDFQPAERRMAKVNVNTYMDKPSEPLTLEVVFENLPDGTNCPGTEILNAPSRHLQVVVQNTNYQRLAN
jgi:hypothetical protein